MSQIDTATALAQWPLRAKATSAPSLSSLAWAAIITIKSLGTFEDLVDRLFSDGERLVIVLSHLRFGVSHGLSIISHQYPEAIAQARLVMGEPPPEGGWIA